MLAKFFREWGLLLVVPLKGFKGVADVCKLLPVPVLTVLTGFLAFWGNVPWWVVLLTALVVSYVSLTAGMAFERARIPSVYVGSVFLDAPSKVFSVVVRNGEVPVKPRMSVLSVADSFGTRHTINSWEVGSPFTKLNPAGELDSWEEVTFILLTVFPHEGSGNPALCIYAKGEIPIPVSLDVPLEQQGTTTVDMAVYCETTKGERGKSEKFFFFIDPDPGSPAGYKIAEKKQAGTWSSLSEACGCWLRKIQDVLNERRKPNARPPENQRKRSS